MNIETRLFKKVEVDINKVINFDSGIIGYENLKQFMIIHDAEKKNSKILWLQSLDDGDIAFPVIDPLIVRADYNPVVEDELFRSIGEIVNNDIFVLTTLTVPEDITKITTNLKAPIVINPVTMKGCQIIVDNEDYLVRYPIYDIIKSNKDKVEEGE
jgi:flagellar assembly factor FliW